MLLKYKHQEEFEKVENIIQEKTSKKYIIIEWMLTLWLIFVGIIYGILFLLGLGIIISDGLSISDFPTNPIILVVVTSGTIGSIGAFIWLSLVVPLNILRFFKEMKKTFSKLGVLLKYYKDYDEDYEKLDKILELFDSILLFLKKDKEHGFFLTKEEKIALTSWLYLIIADLQSDLSYRISEQKSILEKAKSEASEYIHGTTELNKVSELQQARLDKQIEQFEELQRVLVKV